MSTPQTLRPMARAARTAVERSSGVIRTGSAEPPRWRLERKSSLRPRRMMEATTLPPMTKQRMSEPAASLMYSCTRMFCFRPAKASITLLADCMVSARMTPMPWVPSSSLMTTGGPPTIAITSSACLVPWAKAVTGRPMPLRASSCRLRSLSRARAIATDSLSGYTPITSNCRSTAVP